MAIVEGAVTIFEDINRKIVKAYNQYILLMKRKDSDGKEFYEFQPLNQLGQLAEVRIENDDFRNYKSK